jgi:hypothetical protein
MAESSRSSILKVQPAMTMPVGCHVVSQRGLLKLFRLFCFDLAERRHEAHFTADFLHFSGALLLR